MSSSCIQLFSNLVSSFCSENKRTNKCTDHFKIEDWMSIYPSDKWVEMNTDKIDDKGREILKKLKTCDNLSPENSEEVGCHLYRIAQINKRALGSNRLGEFFTMELSDLTDKEKSQGVFTLVYIAYMGSNKR